MPSVSVLKKRAGSCAGATAAIFLRDGVEAKDLSVLAGVSVESGWIEELMRLKDGWVGRVGAFP